MVSHSAFFRPFLARGAGLPGVVWRGGLSWGCEPGSPFRRAVVSRLFGRGWLFGKTVSAVKGHG